MTAKKTTKTKVNKDVIPPGYVKISELTEWDLLNALVNLLPLETEKIDKDEEQKLFIRLADVDGFTEYLRDTMCADRDRHFTASTPAEQLSIRGAFYRTAYFLGLIRTRETPVKEKREKKMGVTRYGR